MGSTHKGSFVRRKTELSLKLEGEMRGKCSEEKSVQEAQKHVPGANPDTMALD